MKQHFNAYTVREDSKGKDRWTRIGIAFPRDNGGMIVFLDAVPAATEGRYKIVVQPPKAVDGAGE
ncbi:MAG: hypothetical protein ACK4UN_00510 [Limisphaerales bacterium]